MRAGQINRVSTIGLLVCALAALLTVLPVALRAALGATLPPPDPDEGTAAHIFQLSIAALLPFGLVFLATADWTRPSRSARLLAIPAIAVLLAFAALYYLEHVYYPAHY